MSHEPLWVFTVFFLFTIDSLAIAPLFPLQLSRVTENAIGSIKSLIGRVCDSPSVVSTEIRRCFRFCVHLHTIQEPNNSARTATIKNKIASTTNQLTAMSDFNLQFWDLFRRVASHLLPICASIVETAQLCAFFIVASLINSLINPLYICNRVDWKYKTRTELFHPRLLVDRHLKRNWMKSTVTNFSRSRFVWLWLAMFIIRFEFSRLTFLIATQHSWASSYSLCFSYCANTTAQNNSNCFAFAFSRENRFGDL